jgi:hypothetical protein
MAFCIDFTPTINNKPPSNKKNRTGLNVGVVVGAGVLSLLSVFVVFYIVRRRKQLPTNDYAGKSKIILYIYASCRTSLIFSLYSRNMELMPMCEFILFIY